MGDKEDANKAEGKPEGQRRPDESAQQAQDRNRARMRTEKANQAIKKAADTKAKRKK